MSAVLGCIDFDGRGVDTAGLRAGGRVIAAYGPDGRDELILDSAGFVHCQLNIARRDAPERQPLAEGAVTIVADAVLDDREGLAGALGLDAGEARGLADSALILRAWRRWGEGCLHHLLGDFAFAVWDSARRRLFLARDHVGTRPLYWARRGSTLLFATDVRAILAFRRFDWPVDEGTVARYLHNADRPLPKTFFRDVHAVLPGHWQVFTATGTRASRWWDPARLPQQAGIGEDEAADRLRELIVRAVACRLDTGARVGSHLSGGIDSTAVTVVAARALKARGSALAAAYCWAPALSDEHPDMGEWDERGIVAEVAAAEGFPLRHGDAGAPGFLSYLARPLEHEGTADLAEELPVIAKARADGVRLMLSGWGGDEAVTAHGIGYPAWLLARGRPGAAVRAARARGGGTRHPWRVARVLWTEGIVPMLPDRLFDIWSPYARMYPRRSFMSRDLALRYPAPERDIRPRPSPRGYSAGLLLRGHLAMRMETWAAWGATAGMQYRYPLLDRRLLEFVLSLPPDVLHGQGRGRHLVRKALRGILPRRLSKQDLANERLRDRVRDAVWRSLAARLPEADAARRWLDMPALRDEIARLPPQDHGTAVIAFAEICAALRIIHLSDRMDNEIETMML